MKKLISLILVVILTFVLTVPVFAAQQKIEYGNISEENATAWIAKTSEKSEVEIYGELVSYYYGSSFTVVKDESGYSLIEFLDDGNVLVNGIQIKSRTIETATPHTRFYARAAGESWVYYNTIQKEYNVIGLAPGIVGGLIGGKVGAVIGGKMGEVFSIVGGAIAGLVVGGVFPEYYVTTVTKQYYKTPVTTSRPVTRNDVSVYHGPKSNRTQNYWFSV